MADGEDVGSADPVFLGGSEMATAMRLFPWESSPLGPPGRWPGALRSACRICLTSRFPMLVWWGPQLRCLYNDGYRPFLGGKHPAIGRPGREVWPEIWHIVGPMLDGVLETGAATWSEDLLLPVDRHGFREETYWTYSYSPLHDDGVVRGVFTAVSETTEQVVGARRLAALRDLSAGSGTARSVDEALGLVTDSLGRAPADVPFAAVFLRGPAGEPVLRAASPGAEAASPAALDPAAWPVNEVLETGDAVTVTDLGGRLDAMPRDGWRTAPSEAVVLPLIADPGSGVLGAMVLAASAGRPLDEGYRTFFALVAQQTSALVNGALAYQVQLRRAEEFAELDRAKSAFFANISHEFRTPLALIVGPVRDLRDRLADGDERDRSDLEIIHRNGLRLGKLVNTLLDFSRIEAGRMRAEFRPVDLAARTADLASVFRSAIEAAGLAFEVDLPTLPRPVHVDVEMWEKIVLNLLSNALKFTFDGAVRVSLAAEGDEVVLRVADTGVGIAASEMPHVFERFHRAPHVRARSAEGSGIGLALVRELVELHTGTISVDSVEGEGSVFTVRLPFGPANPTQAQASSAAAPARTSDVAEPFIQEALRWVPSGAERDETAGRAQPDRPRVLIVDDNADLREYLERLLRPEYRVETVADGHEALRSLRASPPELVVSDVMMPRLDGLELVAAIRADPRTAGVPVLMLSARAGEESAVEGIAAGADGYLSKPFSAAQLLARVAGAIEIGRVRRRENARRSALIEALQEGFFVCAEDGAVIEINSAFADLLGFGADGLPYALPHPWWPGESADRESRQMAADTFAAALEQHGGSFVLPWHARDGRGLWAAVNLNEVRDDHDRRMFVGTVRDVTEERHAVQRESAMAALSLRLSRADGGEALVAALDELRRLWQAERVSAVVWDAPGRAKVLHAVPDGDWTDLTPQAHRAVGALRDENPLHPVAAAEPANGVGVRLEAPDGPLAVWLDLPEAAPRLAAREQTLLALLCGYLEQSLHRERRFEQQRDLALTLQRAMLSPSQMPEGFAARYEPAGRPLEVGGDWYDVFELPSGRVGIVLGDCVGRGLAAATVMAQLRSAARALFLRAERPAEVLEALDDFAAKHPGAAYTTVFCGVLETDTGRLTYSTAGHPPPILVPPDASAQLLDQARSVPLAVSTGTPRPTATCRIAENAMLLTYTDGLVERRRVPLETGIARVTELLAGMEREPLERVADQIMTRTRPGGAYEDDVAILLYRHSPRWTIVFPPDAGELARMRAGLRDWLADRLQDPVLTQDLLIAAGEACANAVEHGNRHGQGREIRLTASLAEGELVMTVSDGGAWKPPGSTPAPYRGHGLAMIRAMMDDVAIDAAPGGTTVRMYKRIAQ